MKKQKCIMVIILAVLTLLVISTKVQAVEAEDFKGLQTLEITTPAGEYKTGDTITFVATFANNIAGYTGLTHTLQVKFSESDSNDWGYVGVGTAVGNKITYQYTLREVDKGILTLKMYSITTLTGEGSTKTDSFDNNVVIKANVPKTPTIVDPEWTDGSKIKMSLAKEMTTTGKYYSVVLNVTGLELNKDYYFYVMNGTTKPTVATETNGRISNATFSITGNQKSEMKRILKNEIAEKNGDIYVWIYEAQKDTTNAGKIVNKCIVSGTKLQRPAQNKLGSRMLCYFFSDYTSSYIYEPVQEYSNRKINLKIGTVTDQSILRAIKNGDADCLNKLLNYAKSAKSPTYTGTITISTSGKSITGNMKLVDQQYYYVYMTLEGENGTYYPVEDVSLYQAHISESIGKNLWDYLDSNFKWNIADDDSGSKVDGNKVNDVKDNTVAPGKLPQTGEGVILYVMIAVALTGIVITAIKYKKYNIKF